MKKERILATVIFVFSLIQYTTFAFAKASFGRDMEESPVVRADTQQRLEQLEQRRQELRERASLARKKEQVALLQLSRIKNKLSVTTGALRPVNIN